MNRIVRENFPANALPDELRTGIPADAIVKVVVEYAVEEAATTKRLGSLDELYAMARPSFYSLEEIVDHIRAIRDEWNRPCAGGLSR